MKPIAKQKMRRVRMPLLHRNTEFRIVPIVVFFRLANFKVCINIIIGRKECSGHIMKWHYHIFV